MRHQQGVTLVELMISVAIVAIILAFVGPSIQSILIKNRIVSEINETSSILQYARHHAIDEQALVVVCPSANFETCGTDWNEAKIAFIDEDDNGERGDGEALLVTVAASSSTSLMTNTSDIIKFAETGEVNEATEVLICHDSGDAKYARALSISLQGRVKMSSDSDNNGINENANGVELSC